MIINQTEYPTVQSLIESLYPDTFEHIQKHLASLNLSATKTLDEMAFFLIGCHYDKVNALVKEYTYHKRKTEIAKQRAALDRIEAGLEDILK